MAAATWDALALELLKHGYRPVRYLEVYCATCGDWRGGVDWPEYGGTIPCPKCSKAATSFCVLGRGFTRCQTLKWVRISPPVPGWVKGILDDDREWKGPRLPVFKPDPGKSADQSSEGVEASETIPAGEKLKPRDVLILKLLAEDLPPESVAEKLNPPTTGRAVIQTMFRVRKVLQCSTTAGACCKAMRQGLIS